MKRLIGDRRGATLVEFTFVAPVMIMVMMGLCDLTYQIYARSILNGAVQKAARDSTIQGAADQTGAIDQRVINIMGGLVGTITPSCATTPAAATWCATRTNFTSFAQAGPEPFNDDNNDGIRQTTECYSDINGNSKWDASAGPGNSGQGGASDVTVYTMKITYARIFPVASLFGWPTTQTIIGSTLLKNQPYQTQSGTAVAPKTICT
ncbi:pilus assembly protein [Sphingomonas sp. PsM26]|nr:pilus assembly protein [Sphingomonas sp. PsM26]